MIVWNNLTIANNSAASGITIQPIDSNTLEIDKGVHIQGAAAIDNNITVSSNNKTATLTSTKLTVSSISATNLNVSGEATINGHLAAIVASGESQQILEAMTFSLAANTKSIYVRNTNNVWSLDMSGWNVRADSVNADRVVPTYLGNYNAFVSTAYIRNLGATSYKVENAYISNVRATTASVDTLIATKMGNIHNKVYMYIGQYKNDDNDAFIFISGGKSGQSYRVQFTVGSTIRTCTCTFDANSHGIGKWGTTIGRSDNDGYDYSNRMLHLDNFFTGDTITITVNDTQKYTGTPAKQKFTHRIELSSDGEALDYSIMIENTNYMDVLIPTIYNNSDYYAMLFFTICGEACAHGYTYVTYDSADNTGYRSLLNSSESFLNPCLPNPYYNSRATFVKASSL